MSRSTSAIETEPYPDLQFSTGDFGSSGSKFFWELSFFILRGSKCFFTTPEGTLGMAGMFEVDARWPRVLLPID